MVTLESGLMTYGEKLTELMEIKGFTARSLSEATDGEVAVGTINQIKQDLAKAPNAHTLALLCNALQVSMDEFKDCDLAGGRNRRRKKKQ
ncbi:MAG: helix-turn-helix transcriptional regulator [Planctomycetia bacterium]|nr:helix-turn-helix transcriptional regulator [Planctomycetia bacterium]